jgi:DNA-binding transcriptional ArsR family regulator
MVLQQGLDQVFGALSDATRRSILETLGRGPATVTQLAAPFGVSLTAVKKHLHVLEQAGLVTTEKIGRSRHCRLGTESLGDAMSWITFYQRLWERRLDGLDAYFTLTKGDNHDHQ